MNDIDELLKKRDHLQAISDVSFQYSFINRKFPLKNITNPEDYKYVIKKYDDLLDKIINLANTIQHENKDNMDKNI